MLLLKPPFPTSIYNANAFFIRCFLCFGIVTKDKHFVFKFILFIFYFCFLLLTMLLFSKDNDFRTDKGKIDSSLLF